MARTFPLSGLLRLRELQESKAAGELAAANKALRGGKTAVKNVQDAAGVGEEYPVDAATMLAVAASRASTSGMLLELNALVETLNEAAQSAGFEHQRARAEVKALEKLSDRHATALRLEDLGREQALLDDLGSARSLGRNA
ncbi:flagellar export protein FliJ [Paeniglutamicibacter sp. NPDC091659]|uniref:flagellar export protein FliJ n=1 Tax=Paeniglutamicibacter sp. NPDC091659 TaxID=3364389 RepID=UPI00381453E7